MLKKMLTTVIVAVLLPLSFSSLAAEPKNMKEVMQIISSDMQQVVKGISEEDYALIARKAKDVAFHKEPPVKQRQAFLKELKSELAAFKAHDNQVHASAMAMKKAAEEKNMLVVIENYTKTLQACVACHQGYRDRMAKVEW
jgi:cytochrome c556